MACPFFMPVDRLAPLDWIHAPRLPLGDAWRGVCRTVAGESFEPPESDQRNWCNCGYARGACSRLPESAPDAVRFSVTEELDGRLKLVWILEKDHAPAEFGTLDYSAGVLSAPANEVLAAQVRAFVSSYLTPIAR